MIKTIDWNGKTIEFDATYVNMGFILDMTNAGSEKEALNMQHALLKQCIKTPIDLRKLMMDEWTELVTKILESVKPIARPAN